MKPSGFVIYNAEQLQFNPDYYKGWIMIKQGMRRFWTIAVVHEADITEHKESPMLTLAQ